MILTIVLAVVPAPARAQKAVAGQWLGKRVIQRYNNFPLRIDGQAVLRSGMVLVVAGAVLGLAATLGAASLLKTLLFGVDPRDPRIYAIVAAGVIGVGLLANLIPARRAASLSPTRALRE